MKTFTELCRITQPKLKTYMKEYLSSKGYAPICEDGFLYAKGDTPVLLVAHLDTVHKEAPKEISHVGNRISSPQGIGGDDRCGVFIIANIVQELKCSVLLCEDEEKGGIGANKFVNTKYSKELGVNYMVEFDRKGNSDAVFYNCASEDFQDFVLKHTGFEKKFGSFSDISVLMPNCKLCGVNLSSGYYNAHTQQEYVIYDEMMYTATKAKELIKTECEKPFEYKKAAEFLRSFDYYEGYDWYTEYKSAKPKKAKSVVDMIKDDVTIELEAIAITSLGEEEILLAQGMTKAECWMNLFVDYPHVCMNDIIDYSFM